MFPALERAGVHIRQGQLTLVAAGPGVGKSALVLTLAMRARVPTLYVSADSDAFTQYIRSVAMLTGVPVWQVEQDMANGKNVHYDTLLRKENHLQWVFDPNPTLEDIAEEARSFAYVTGDWPRLIIIDCVMNVWSDGVDETTRNKEVLEFLHTLQRETGAAVIALHHLTGEFDDGTRPAPMSALLGKVSKLPEMILTLHKSGSPDYGDMLLNVSAVKNRNGKADPSGSWYVSLPADLEHMRIG
ncbi:DnaB-like helicase C-terminal domain-containing protein [Streptomyces sp. NPDC050507]|uniref:DnaB-like helicase C-terminal domain-containing protein n=1 Tax=Streptomyces sp. NPDC050507 TaxID=3365619 RepID=UPI00379E6341